MDSYMNNSPLSGLQTARRRRSQRAEYSLPTYGKGSASPYKPMGSLGLDHITFHQDFKQPEQTEIPIKGFGERMVGRDVLRTPVTGATCNVKRKTLARNGMDRNVAVVMLTAIMALAVLLLLFTLIGQSGLTRQINEYNRSIGFTQQTNDGLRGEISKKREAVNVGKGAASRGMVYIGEVTPEELTVIPGGMLYENYLAMQNSPAHPSGTLASIAD